MSNVVMYSSMLCPYCSMAKQLLAEKGVEFDETDISFSSDKRNEMMTRANGKHSVPQIFIDDAHIGGCDDLYALESAGKLDAMLGIS